MRGRLGLGAVGVLAAVCCAALPLLAAALGAAALAWIGGLALFPLALAAGAVAVRARRAAAASRADRAAGGARR
ncbi:hypothetical protein Gocc_2119 [Gaiella occulta]|uniref:Uncharacterized protein n=1 Tax=Gaiella occulta TaxID=1002870 RepID=A0A7M2YV51_9ACTN|nr:hypothetical protein Gocc_2119 [Gaiella occulta]